MTHLSGQTDEHVQENRRSINGWARSAFWVAVVSAIVGWFVINARTTAEIIAPVVRPLISYEIHDALFPYQLALLLFGLISGIIAEFQINDHPDIYRGKRLAILGMVFPLLALFLSELSYYQMDKATCISQIRQISVAIQMYAQDNQSRYPGTDWVKQTAKYLGGSERMYNCSTVKVWWNAPSRVSYGYSGLLINPDGTGIQEKQVLSPSEVGSICDADPTVPFPDCGIVGGAALQPHVLSVQPALRHANGTVAGFCDGHAKYYPRATHPQPRDTSDGIVRAFYQISPLGLVDNPIGGMPDFTTSGRWADSTIHIGGEYAARCILLAAAQAWQVKAGAAYACKGFLGQDNHTGRTGAWAWAIGDGVKPGGHAVPVARDAVVMIVTKNSKIPALGKRVNQTYVLDYTTIRLIYCVNGGYVANSVQAYTLPAASGTRRFFTRRLGIKTGYQTVEVANDAEMVDKVVNDPYGIGYCSSVFADPDRLSVISLPAPGGGVFTFPQADPKHRWELPATLSWPMMRTLYVQCGGAALVNGSPCFASEMLAPQSPGLTALQQGPLYRLGFWTP